MSGRRLILAAAVTLTVAFIVWVLWPYIVGAAVTLAAWRVLRRDTRRRRPKSSWSSLGRTGATLFAAWNSRWLKGPLLKASVPASADGVPNPLLKEE